MLKHVMGILVYSGTLPCAAVRLKNAADSEGQFSLVRTMEENPTLINHFESNMRSILEAYFLQKESTEPMEPSMDNANAKLMKTITNIFRQTKAVPIEGELTDSKELAKLPAERTQILLEMGNSLKEALSIPHLADVVAGQVAMIKKNCEEHPEISADVARLVENARPKAAPITQNQELQAMPQSLLKEFPGLAKKLMSMMKPVVLPYQIPELSLLQSSSNFSRSMFTSDTQSPAFQTRFEAGINFDFPLPCKTPPCFKVPIGMTMERLVPGLGFIILTTGIAVVSENFQFSFKGPFIPVPVMKDTIYNQTRDNRVAGLTALKTGFAISLNFVKQPNMLAIQKRHDDSMPKMTFSFGTSLIPIAATMKFDQKTFVREEPMIELAMSNDFKISNNATSSRNALQVATAIKWRTAFGYYAHQFFAISKLPLGTLSPWNNWEMKGPGSPKGFVFGLLYHLCPGESEICEKYDDITGFTPGDGGYRIGSRGV